MHVGGERKNAKMWVKREARRPLKISVRWSGVNDGGKLLPLADEKLPPKRALKNEKFQLTMFGLLLAVCQFLANGFGGIMLIEVHTTAPLSAVLRSLVHSSKSFEILLVLGFLAMTHERVKLFFVGI